MKLPEINATLEKLVDPLKQCIEIARTGSKGEEVAIFANREGLIQIAAYCLDLAERESEGAHYHFDETSVDAAEVPMVITYKKRPNKAVD
ncbi:Imm32 family immunity protein [Sulfuriroseicoccus oceanibius]|uniref:Uncharacterized protein n=1 Tax=Sulfuriroseicoccus oceanibius TaxID=2707525 RepID=A0A6B3LCU7_9BACT|nr:hypothetical protein [Sulfuriroseicoccus oceanibius]QQL44619.1 hypothetical protein G3M56_012110 [Sulfuriroseicoccus oceanibius]